MLTGLRDQIDVAYWWCRRAWFYHLHPRHVWTMVATFVQRGYRGWGDRDLIWLDHYLERTLSQALVKLADDHHGYPCMFQTTDPKTGEAACVGMPWATDFGKRCTCDDVYSAELRRAAELFRKLAEDDFGLDEWYEVRCRADETGDHELQTRADELLRQMTEDEVRVNREAYEWLLEHHHWIAD